MPALRIQNSSAIALSTYVYMKKTAAIQSFISPLENSFASGCLTGFRLSLAYWPKMYMLGIFVISLVSWLRFIILEGVATYKAYNAVSDLSIALWSLA